MNNEKREKVLKLLEENKDLREKVIEIKTEAEKAGKSAEAYAKKLEAIARENGVDVTADEILEALQQQADKELSDKDLDAVNGGAEAWDIPRHCRR